MLWCKPERIVALSDLRAASMLAIVLAASTPGLLTSRPAVRALAPVARTASPPTMMARWTPADMKAKRQKLPAAVDELLSEVRHRPHDTVGAGDETPQRLPAARLEALLHAPPALAVGAHHCVLVGGRAGFEHACPPRHRRTRRAARPRCSGPPSVHASRRRTRRLRPLRATPAPSCHVRAASDQHGSCTSCPHAHTRPSPRQERAICPFTHFQRPEQT